MQKDKIQNVEALVDEEGGAKRGNLRGHMIALVICLLVAVVVWATVMGRNDSDYIRLEVKGGNEALTYELSGSVLEVEGKVSALRRAEVIYVCVPQDATAPGEYTIRGNDLELPQGVALTGEVALTLRVSAK